MKVYQVTNCYPHVEDLASIFNVCAVQDDDLFFMQTMHKTTKLALVCLKCNNSSKRGLCQAFNTHVYVSI